MGGLARCLRCHLGGQRVGTISIVKTAAAEVSESFFMDKEKTCYYVLTNAHVRIHNHVHDRDQSPFQKQVPRRIGPGKHDPQIRTSKSAI